MTEGKLRLLLLSAGTRVAQNVIDALGTRRESCVLIAANSVAEAAGNFRCDTAYLIPAAASSLEYVERVAELIWKEHPDLVIPCRDDDVIALAMLAEQSPPGHAVLLTGTVAAARIMNDKVETARFARRHGLAFAPTAENVRDALELARAHGLPLIGKPRCGNASHGVVILRSTAEIDRAFELRADLIAQPFLDPPENLDTHIAPFEGGLPFFFSLPGTSKYSVQVFVGADGTVSNSFGTLSIEVGGSAVEYRQCNDPDLLELGQCYGRAAAAEGWKGPLNVQAKRTCGGGLVAFEINGRLTGGTAPRTLMGFDEIGEVISRFLPGADFPLLAGCGFEVVQLQLSSYAVPSAGVAALQTSGKWSRE